MSAIAVITTVGTEEQANDIAEALVARRHAACVNILPRVRSVYRWQGKICTDGELMLVIKSTEEEFEAIAEAIRELHNYELPEILSFRIDHCEPSFLKWIGESVDKTLADTEEDEGADEPSQA